MEKKSLIRSKLKMAEREREIEREIERERESYEKSYSFISIAYSVFDFSYLLYIYLCILIF